MFVCRLFHRDRPFEEVEARNIVGAVTIGRDASADWRLADGAGTLSRIHCKLEVEDGRLFLRDLSTNGTFVDGDTRAPADARLEIKPRQSLRLGAFTVLVEAAALRGAEDRAATVVGSAAPVAPVPEGWTDPAPARAPHRDASLIEAFCEGAKLDASAMSSEDPAELMRRVGAIYQQTVLGLAALMASRAAFKGEHDLERTTIGAAENNPFKWAPSRKLAQDLLSGGDPSFLSDAAAVRASFEDLNRHFAALCRGAEAAAQTAVNAFAPDVIEAEARAQGSLLKSRAAACWEIHRGRHAALAAHEGCEQGSLDRAFREAYARSLGAQPC